MGAGIGRAILGSFGAMALSFSGSGFAQASPSPYTSGTGYDAMGRVTGTISADSDGVRTSNPFLALRTTYEGHGLPIKVEKGALATWRSEAVAPAAWGSAFYSLEFGRNQL